MVVEKKFLWRIYTSYGRSAWLAAAYRSSWNEPIIKVAGTQRVNEPMKWKADFTNIYDASNILLDGGKHLLTSQYNYTRILQKCNARS